MPKTKYNITTAERSGKTYHFITRGRSKPFTDEEMTEFFGEHEEKSGSFRVEGHLRRIFAQDLKLGLPHCSTKYGATESAILSEARRLFPHQNIDKIVGTFAR